MSDKVGAAAHVAPASQFGNHAKINADRGKAMTSPAKAKIRAAEAKKAAADKKAAGK